MSRISVCTYSMRRNNDREWKVLSIFVHPHPFSDDHIDEVIAKILAAEGPFDTVHFVGFPESLAAIQSYYKAGSVTFDRLRHAIPDLANRLWFIGLDEEGRLQIQDVDSKIINDEYVLAQERRQSLQRIFIEKNGLMTANKGVHYTKPSGKHSPQFLRAANVLEDSSVALQIAFWLFPYIAGKQIQRIVVDTSGIDSVAFALGYERARRQLQFELPIIESHSSYGGLDKLIVSDPEQTFFLISASTSGGLHRELVSRGARHPNIVTLYYLGQGCSDAGLVLTDLTFEKEENEWGLTPIPSFDLSACPYCKQHSYAIPIVGDQFSTEPARIEEIEVLLSDFSEEHRKVLGQLVSTGLFKVYRSIERREMELFLDIDALMFNQHTTSPEAIDNARSIRQKWARLIKRSMPVHLKRIVHTNYPGAKCLASDAAALLPLSMQPQISTLGAKNISTVAEDPESATLVVSACLDETHELMGISRDLRIAQPGGNTSYVAPLFRFSSKAERMRIESNLTFGEHGPKTFNLYSCMQIEMPPCEAKHSWNLEFTRLQELLHWTALEDINVPPEIEARIAILRDAPAKGLEDDLFWPEVNGNALRLASDFTIIPNRDGQRYFSQADIFTIVASLFHQYRHGVKGKPRLTYKPYERTVISPESFQRFSDGVLQAAFLRAARGSEISYANCDVSVSERMLAFLLAEIDAAKHGRGPALMEYIIAIIVGRLTLHPDQQRRFLEQVVSESGLPAPMRVCARFALQS